MKNISIQGKYKDCCDFDFSKKCLKAITVKISAGEERYDYSILIKPHALKIAIK